MIIQVQNIETGEIEMLPIEEVTPDIAEIEVLERYSPIINRKRYFFALLKIDGLYSVSEVARSGARVGLNIPAVEVSRLGYNATLRNRINETIEKHGAEILISCIVNNTVKR